MQSAGQTVSPLTVYHGSPHKFPPTAKNPLGEFDSTKIGTGEGAQAYGHGLYLAEAPATAKTYVPRSPKFEENLVKLYNKAQSSSNYPMMEVLEDAMLHRTPSEIIQKFSNVDDGYSAQHAKAAQDFAKWYSKNEPEIGGLYTVDLPDEKIARMLDWDKPLSEQSPEVQKIINDEIKRIGGSAHSGQQAYKELMFQARMAGKKSDSQAMKNNLEALEASKRLQELGIPGIKYLDEGSRSNFRVQNFVKDKPYGEPVSFMTEKQALDYAAEQAEKGFTTQMIPGTSNFVVFPGEEDALTILERKKEGGEVKMAEGGAAFGRYTTGKKYQKAVKQAKEADVNKLPDPRTYAAVMGLLGSAPDQLGFSVMHPDYKGIQKAGERGFVGGTILGVAPVVAPLTRGLPVGASIKPFGPKELGRFSFEIQTPERMALNAEAAKKMAAMPPRSKAAVTEMGLYHPVGGGLKLSTPTWAMQSTTVPDFQFKPPPISVITPEQLVKEEAAMFPLVGDRAAAGKYLTHVGENELEIPVRLTGGPRYMDANYNPVTPEESAAWESGLGRVTALSRQAERAGEGGRTVYGVYTAGSGTNTDFNVMGANALLQQIPFSKITKKSEKEFDRAMREGSKEFPPIPNWPGIRSPEAQTMLLDKSNGIVRTKLFGTMGKENFQSMGFPDVPATRKAIIEPELLDVPTNEAGYRLARMDTTGRIIENPIIPSDYPTAMAGQVAGRLDVPVDYKDVFQSHFDARRLLGQPESGDYYSFSRAHPIQYANQEWLDRIMKAQEAKNKLIRTGGYAKGGEVKPASGLSTVNKLCGCHD
jgi:hypothetical protein